MELSHFSLYECHTNILQRFSIACERTSHHVLCGLPHIFASFSNWALHLSYLIFSFLGNITNLLVNAFCIPGEINLQWFDLLSRFLSTTYQGKQVCYISTLWNYDFPYSSGKIIFFKPSLCSADQYVGLFYRMGRWEGNFLFFFFWNTEQLLTRNILRLKYRGSRDVIRDRPVLFWSLQNNYLNE